MVSLLLTLNIFQPCSSVSIVNLEQVITGWAKAPEALSAETTYWNSTYCLTNNILRKLRNLLNIDCKTCKKDKRNNLKYYENSEPYSLFASALTLCISRKVVPYRDFIKVWVRLKYFWKNVSKLAKHRTISPNFLVWQYCGNQCPQSFHKILTTGN